MTTIPPLWTVVRDPSRPRRPPADWVHVALHGQFDPQGDDDGWSCWTADEPAEPVQQFLTTRQLQSFELSQRPFVFLNACQVGSANRVLGSYSGMAVALLRGGAIAVVAPQWNIDDDVAGTVTDTFYASVLGDASVRPGRRGPRAIRATYTEVTSRLTRRGLPPPDCLPAVRPPAADPAPGRWQLTARESPVPTRPRGRALDLGAVRLRTPVCAARSPSTSPLRPAAGPRRHTPSSLRRLNAPR